MKLLPEDPRITAYALGEIEDPAEREEIEAAVAATPELQEAVASIRDMGDLLGSSLASEAAPELSEFDKTRMERPEAEIPKKNLLSWPIITSIAAILLLALVLIPQLGQVEESFTYQSEPRQESKDEVKTYRVLEVSIPDEVIEGTPQPIKVPNLEPAPTSAPQIIVESMVFADAVPEIEYDQDASVTAAIAPLETALPKVAPPPPPPPSSMRTMKSMPRPVPEMLSVQDANGAISLGTLNVELSKQQGRGIGGGFGEISAGVAMPAATMRVTPGNFNTESYDPIEETDFRSPLVAPLSTFSIDVDTASYANVRRFLDQGQLPPADAVRIEELINYFPYADAAPTQSLDDGGDPFAVHMAQTMAPWSEQNRLLRIALKGYEMPWEDRPASNLVFLLDVSGSMNQPNKLPLVKDAMDILIRRLDQRDRVAIVVYAGASGLVLPSTTANNHETIEHALANLAAGGSTNAGAGIELAYKTARKHFIEGGNNRVILCTDGDFNIGQTNRGQLSDIVEGQAEEGVSMTILGFGMNNYKDDMLETLSNKGKGTYAYVDSRAEAHKVFLEDLASNIFKIAKDVKIQVEFNPAQVKAYRLIGYENRRLKAEDFNNDAKKAGDIGPGHTVVALYELVPVGGQMELPGVDALRYQKQSQQPLVPSEVATVKLRYKQPNGDVSKLLTHSVDSDELVPFKESSEDVRFSAAVAAFGLRLTASEHVADFGYAAIEKIAVDALGQDPGGHRSEFTELVRKADDLESRTSKERAPKTEGLKD